MSEIRIRKEYFWPILLLIVLFISLAFNLFVTMNTPLAFGDEGYYATRGEYILKNLEIPKYIDIYPKSVLFREYWTDVPFIILVVSDFFIFGEMFVKMMNPILLFLAGLMLFLFVRRVYSERSGFFATLFLVIMPAMITYAVLLYADMLLVLLFITFLYFLYRALEENRYVYLISSGAVAGLAALTKQTGLLLPLLFLFILILYRKGALKRFCAMLLIFTIVIMPWFGIHNYLQFGNPGLPGMNYLGFDFPIREIYGELPKGSENPYSGGLGGGGGASAGFFQAGMVNFIEFAYNLDLFIFVLGGMSLLALRRKRKDLFILISLLILAPFIIHQGIGGRIEELSRFLLPLAAVMAVGAGVFADKVYSFLEEFHRVIALLFVLVILLWGVSIANAKDTSLEGVKKWPQGFMDGCEWVKLNTPKNSILLTIWQAPTEYHCQRGAVWGQLPDINTIVFGGDPDAYEHLKLHGIDYVYIQKFSISFGRNWPNYPMSFVNYLRNSPNYENVYENNDVVLFKVK